MSDSSAPVTACVRRRSSRRWRGLLLHVRQLCVDPCPAGCRRRPDRYCRIGEIRIVKGTDTDENQMRSRLCLAEERCPARRAESPVHLVAAVRDTWIVAGLPSHRESLCAEAGVDRSAAGTDILTLPTPANARDNRRRRAFPADGPTEASTCDRHTVLPRGHLMADRTSESPTRQITQASAPAFVPTEATTPDLGVNRAPAGVGCSERLVGTGCRKREPSPA